MTTASSGPSLPPATPTPTPARDPLSDFRAPPSAASLGLGMYLGGMTIGFAWLFVGFLAVRSRLAVEDIGVPRWFWVSTFVVLVSSVLVQYACALSRAARPRGTRRSLIGTLVLGLLFLLLQVLGFVAYFGGASGDPAVVRLYYLIAIMAALHGAHLLGGIGYLASFIRRPAADPIDARHVVQLTVYWHYLTVVWMAMFSLFLLAS